MLAAINPTPSGTVTKRLRVGSFSMVMTAADNTMNQMLATPPTKASSISAQQHPRHDSPWRAPMRAPPRTPSRQNFKKNVIGLTHSVRQCRFSEVNWYAPAAASKAALSANELLDPLVLMKSRPINQSCAVVAATENPIQMARYPARNAHQGRVEVAPRTARSEINTGTAVGAIIAVLISAHIANTLAASSPCIMCWAPMWWRISAAQLMASPTMNTGHGDHATRRGGAATVAVLADPTSDHYSDRIDLERNSNQLHGPVELDARLFAQAIVGARVRRGWSTRELSHRARISQPYVVALERSRETRRGSGSKPAVPNPTVDVLARLAHALGIDAVQLFASSLRPTGRHALLVVDGSRRSPLEHVQRVVPAGVERWVCADSGGNGPGPSSHGHHSINLRRSGRQPYEPSVIARSLGRELDAIATDLDGHEVGFVFGETSAVMSRLADPHAVISFEHEWAEVVSGAAANVGAHAAWNVCVYEISALRALAAPVKAAVDLMRSHDVIWAAERSTIADGTAAARTILGRLRPPDIASTAWRTRVDHMIADLGLVA